MSIFYRFILMSFSPKINLLSSGLSQSHVRDQLLRMLKLESYLSRGWLQLPHIIALALLTLFGQGGGATSPSQGETQLGRAENERGKEDEELHRGATKLQPFSAV